MCSQQISQLCIFSTQALYFLHQVICRHHKPLPFLDGHIVL